MSVKRNFGLSFASGTDVRLVTNSLGWLAITCEVATPLSFPSETQIRNVLDEVGKQMNATTIIPISIFPLGDAE